MRSDQSPAEGLGPSKTVKSQDLRGMMLYIVTFGESFFLVLRVSDCFLEQ